MNINDLFTGCKVQDTYDKSVYHVVKEVDRYVKESTSSFGDSFMYVEIPVITYSKATRIKQYDDLKLVFKMNKRGDFLRETLTLFK